MSHLYIHSIGYSTVFTFVIFKSNRIDVCYIGQSQTQASIAEFACVQGSHKLLFPYPLLSDTNSTLPFLFFSLCFFISSTKLSQSSFLFRRTLKLEFRFYLSQSSAKIGCWRFFLVLLKTFTACHTLQTHPIMMKAVKN